MNGIGDASGFGAWRKSSYSHPNNQCVEMAWRKSSYSNPNNDCVEVAVSERAVGLRDSKNPDGPRLAFGQSPWATFVDRITSR